MTDHDVQDSSAQTGFFRRHWRLVLRVSIYGAALLLGLMVAAALFFPVAEPTAVRSVNAEKSAPASPHDPAHALAQTTTTQIVSPPDRYDPGRVEQWFDNIRMRMVTYESLFSRNEQAVDEKKVADLIQQRVERLKPRIEQIDQLSRTQPYTQTNEAILDISEELNYLLNDISSHVYFRKGQFLRVEKWPEWADNGRAAFLGLAKQLEAGELKHFVRHEHWATAAKLCEYRRDNVQAVYYWRKAGGYEGRLRSVLSVISLPLEGPQFMRGYNTKTLPDKLFFVGVPEEDNPLFMMMLQRHDWN